MILAQVEHKDSAQDAHPYGTLGQPVAQLHAREHEPAKPSVLSGESGTRPGTCEEREHHGQVAIVLIVPAAIRAHETERLVSRRGREGNQYSASEELKGVQLVGLPVEDAGGGGEGGGGEGGGGDGGGVGRVGAGGGLGGGGEGGALGGGCRVGGEGGGGD